MARTITADLSKSFPTLPGIDLHSGRVLEYEVSGGSHLQLIRVHDGVRARLYVSVRDAAGRFARDLSVTVDGRVTSATPRTRKEALEIGVAPGKQTLHVSSGTLGVAVEIHLVMPADDHTATSQGRTGASRAATPPVRTTKTESASSAKRTTRRR